MSSLSPTDFLAQLKAFNASAYDPSSVDPVIRKEIHEASQKLAYAYEDPVHGIQRVTLGQVSQSAVMKVALDINLFPSIARKGVPHTLSELASATDTDPSLLLRLVRFLATCGVVVENGDGRYSLARPFSLLSDDVFCQAANECIGLIKPMFDHLPGLIQDNGRRDPDDRFNGAAQRAMNAPGKELFDLLKEKGPVAIQSFGTFLGAMSKDSKKIHEVYPVEERLIQGFDSSNSEYFWVDVGGGFGGFTLDLKQKFPNLPGKCVVEEMGQMVDAAAARGVNKQVDFLAHDFFTEQPIKGARGYYMRECFHNWQDSNCRIILEKLSEAMKPGYSRILIHELVIPETGANQWQVTMDLLMMGGYSTLERDEKRWTALVESAGLKINKIYSDFSAESIIEIVKE